ncbi:unnamed protein product [Timema podura]|uniref:Uncharacterized protein n=1 Tax=Timema podura TaxID=61482 RepID=A0ABN7NCW2_TIMPD|nr:unnamed protein product [Timema podura]
MSMGVRGRGEHRGERRGGRGGGGWARGPPHPRDYRDEDYRDGTPQRRSEDLTGVPSELPTANSTSSQPNKAPPQISKPLKGVPAVVPDFVIPNNKESPSLPTGPKFPETPNLMQKFSEMTGGADTSVDNIISKGKELIFMKFGLGK